MKRLVWCVCVLSLLAANQAAANLFVNPGFEDPITSDGPPFVGFWEGFNGAGGQAINGTVMPRNGTLNLAISISGVNDSFAGAFQDVPVVAGSNYTFSGWHKTPSNPLDVGVEFRAQVGRIADLLAAGGIFEAADDGVDVVARDLSQPRDGVEREQDAQEGDQQIDHGRDYTADAGRRRICGAPSSKFCG